MLDGRCWIPLPPDDGHSSLVADPSTPTPPNCRPEPCRAPAGRKNRKRQRQAVISSERGESRDPQRVRRSLCPSSSRREEERTANTAGSPRLGRQTPSLVVTRVDVIGRSRDPSRRSATCAREARSVKPQARSRNRPPRIPRSESVVPIASWLRRSVGIPSAPRFRLCSWPRFRGTDRGAGTHTDACARGCGTRATS
jgi:hypothetical protein